MRLSVCFIVRNEAEHLERALKSVCGLADEIVVADTGSADSSRDVARAAGAQVVEFPWIDDFAAARNFSIAHATGDWILWLDADEELFAGDQELVRQAMREPRALGWLVQRLDLHTLAPRESGTWMRQLRLFRRDPALRFRGRCHPTFHPSLEEIAAARGQQLGDSRIRLRHYGYLGGPSVAKQERACRLLRLELQDRPGQIYYEVELGRTLLLTGNPEGRQWLRTAAARLKACLADPQPPSVVAAMLLEYLLLTAPAVAGCPISPVEAQAAAEKWYPQAAPLLWARAQLRYQASDFGEARRLLERLLNLAQTEGVDRWISFNPRLLGDDLRLNLAACCLRLTDLDAAETHLRAIPPDSPQAGAAQKNLAVIADIRRQLP